METLRQAMLDDLVLTLNDRKNNLLARHKSDCHCRNNIDFGLAQLRKSVGNTLPTFEALELYMLNKKCKHTWHRKQMDDASWDVFAPR